MAYVQPHHQATHFGTPPSPAQPGFGPSDRQQSQGYEYGAAPLVTRQRSHSYTSQFAGPSSVPTSAHSQLSAPFHASNPTTPQSPYGSAPARPGAMHAYDRHPSTSSVHSAARGRRPSSSAYVPSGPSPSVPIPVGGLHPGAPRQRSYDSARSGRSQRSQQSSRSRRSTASSSVAPSEDRKRSAGGRERERKDRPTIGDSAYLIWDSFRGFFSSRRV